MDFHIKATDITSGLSYMVSILLVTVDGALTWLDAHAGAIGAMLGMMTFAINWHYQKKRSNYGIARDKLVRDILEKQSKESE